MIVYEPLLTLATVKAAIRSPLDMEHDCESTAVPFRVQVVSLFENPEPDAWITDSGRVLVLLSVIVGGV